MVVAGIDGCKTGWIAVVLGDDASPAAHFLPTIGDVETVVSDAEVIGIDIPIGFPDDLVRRAADEAARRALGARRSSVFLTPPREVLAATTYVAANELAVARTGRGISRQSYGLASKIFEVDSWLGSSPRSNVVEVHPELSFATMLGHPATHSKKTWAGMTERRAALAGEGIALDDAFGLAGARAAVDDLLDAAAVAWTARRVAAGTATCHPDVPKPGADGRIVAIWA